MSTHKEVSSKFTRKNNFDSNHKCSIYIWCLYIHGYCTYTCLSFVRACLCNRLSESRAGGAAAALRVQSVVRSREVTCRGRAGVWGARASEGARACVWVRKKGGEACDCVSACARRGCANGSVSVRVKPPPSVGSVQHHRLCTDDPQPRRICRGMIVRPSRSGPVQQQHQSPVHLDGTRLDLKAEHPNPGSSFPSFLLHTWIFPLGYYLFLFSEISNKVSGIDLYCLDSPAFVSRCVEPASVRCVHAPFLFF